MFYVTGGEYKDTNFTQIMDGKQLERHGPFTSYDDALRAWKALTGRNVDNCHSRYLIEPAA